MERAPPSPCSLCPSVPWLWSRQQLHRHGHLVVLVHTLPLIEHWLRLISIQLWGGGDQEGRS